MKDTQRNSDLAATLGNIGDAIKRTLTVLRDPRRLYAYISWRTHNFDFRKTALNQVPGVIQVGRRATSRRVSRFGKPYFRKVYRDNPSAISCFKQELLARSVFGEREWMPGLVKKGKNWFLLPYYPAETRLDRAVVGMSYEDRLSVSHQALSILFEMFLRGYAHCDFHAENLFWIDGKLIVTDFEAITPYLEGQRPAFPLSYDLIGEGLKSPMNTGNMCYTKDHPRNVSLVNTLGIPLQVPLEHMEKGFKDSLAAMSKTFETRGKRHTCKADRIYCSFSLPHLCVQSHEAQRDSVKRFQQFGIFEETLRGKSLLDLGSNIGGMLFQAQNFAPQRSLGVEYDAGKVDLSRKIAAYNGLNSVRFLQADIDRFRAADVDDLYDVVFCLAIEAHVKEPDRLYRLLSDVCADTVYFEGNSTTNPREVERCLRSNGFHDVKHLGLSRDDCIASNNRRPLLVARKGR